MGLDTYVYRSLKRLNLRDGEAIMNLHNLERIEESRNDSEYLYYLRKHEYTPASCDYSECGQVFRIHPSALYYNPDDVKSDFDLLLKYPEDNGERDGYFYAVISY